MKKIFLFIFLIFPVICNTKAFAGGVVAQKQAVKDAMIQQQQELIKQEYIKQQQDLMKQQYIQQQQEALKAEYQKRALEAQQKAALEEAKHRAQQKQYQLEQQAMKDAAGLKALQTEAEMKGAAELNQDKEIHDEVNPDDIQDAASLDDIWKSFETSSEAWALMLEMKPKMLTVDKYIHIFEQEHVKITQGPLYYAQMIDAISKENPSLLKRPFKEVLRFVTVVDYDFDDGKTDKDQLALKLLGSKGYLANRKRLGKD